ncbi:hypothetical protein [Rickettsiales endosymbiont of Stachyamoeba lipophora]|uniref:hypothetical protein n=1 Tax=Rickettsiales endosymbiont of Stachyamoeba lipophora TaxID=2486578 RepID=UPI000F64727E|nr:hypothetical protein [Rickettsiales endosymbiont of Stachyamoeba lipophora]AZL15553.1 hypothetical protein EF513_03170 [Rickettsiales endosymbiont of Stachyamoeba lipophora]
MAFKLAFILGILLLSSCNLNSQYSKDDYYCSLGAEDYISHKNPKAYICIKDHDHITVITEIDDKIPCKKLARARIKSSGGRYSLMDKYYNTCMRKKGQLNQYK